MMVVFSIILIYCSLTLGADWNDNGDLKRDEKQFTRNYYTNKDEGNIIREEPSDSVLSSDDLFRELNNIWIKKGNKNYEEEQKDYKIHDPISDYMDLTSQPFVSKFADNNTHEPTPTDQNDDDHWTRFRVIMENIKTIMIRMYGDDISIGGDTIMFRLLDKLLEIGDQLNSINTIQNNFDKDLLAFLKKKWSSVEGDLIESYPVLSSVLAIDVKDLFMTIAKGLARQFGNVFHKQALMHLSELGFILQTMRSSGFKDSEIYDVFMLLGLPTEDLVTTSNTLESEARSLGITSLFSRSSHGSHGHGGGYGYQMMTKDPFLILAGLALAAFAAYLLYRLLTTTAMVAVKRSISNDVLSLDLSDMPEAMTNLYRWLDNAEVLYGNVQKKNELNNLSFSTNINQLWRSFAGDNNSGSCIRRYLCQHIHDNKFRAITTGLDLEQLSLIGLAELLGEKGAGKTMDKYITKVIYDEEIDCPAEVGSCHQQIYSLITNDINKRPR